MTEATSIVTVNTTEASLISDVAIPSSQILAETGTEIQTSSVKCEDETRSVNISFDVDIGETSSMFCCMICQELIQSANDHRQCASQPGGDGCGGTICVPCIANLQKRCCPTCGDKYPGVFVSSPIIKKIIYPRVSENCPNKGCGRSFLTVGSHMSECEWRMIACPLCKSEIRIDTIQDHMYNSCKLPWKSCEIGLGCDWNESIVAVCANPIDQKQQTATMCYVNLNCIDEEVTKKNNRIIYAWREYDQVKIMCIQLMAAAGETQSIGISQSEKLTCPVNSFAHFPGPISISVEDFLDHEIGIDQGPWKMRIGVTYEVATGDDKDPMLPDFIARNFRGIGKFTGRLLEILWAPPRGVFVNNLGQSYIANLDAQTMLGIKQVAYSTNNGACCALHAAMQRDPRIEQVIARTRSAQSQANAASSRNRVAPQRIPVREVISEFSNPELYSAICNVLLGGNPAALTAAPMQNSAFASEEKKEANISSAPPESSDQTQSPAPAEREEKSSQDDVDEDVIPGLEALGPAAENIDADMQNAAENLENVTTELRDAAQNLRNATIEMLNEPHPNDAINDDLLRRLDEENIMAAIAASLQDFQ